MLPIGEQRKRFLEVESAPEESAVKTVAGTAKGLEPDMNLVGEVAGGAEGMGSFGEVLLWVTVFQTASHAPETVGVRKSQSMWQTSVLSYFRALPQPPRPSAATPHLSAAASVQEDPPAAERSPPSGSSGDS